MNLEELLDAPRRYSFKDEDKEITYYYEIRDATSAEELEFRRRTGKVTVKNGKLTSSDEALNAPFWLLDRITQKIEYSNGTLDADGKAHRAEFPKELYPKIPQGIRKSAITRYLNATEGEEAEVQKN